MKMAKVKKKEVATLMARCLLEQIGGEREKGLQYGLRQEFNIHGSYFLRERADKLSKEHYAELVGAIAMRKSKKEFLDFWTGYGERLWDEIDSNEELFLCEETRE